MAARQVAHNACKGIADDAHYLTCHNVVFTALANTGSALSGPFPPGALLLTFTNMPSTGGFEITYPWEGKTLTQVVTSPSTVAFPPGGKVLSIILGKHEPNYVIVVGQRTNGQFCLQSNMFDLSTSDNVSFNVTFSGTSTWAGDCTSCTVNQYGLICS